jgi:hypothetical protein
MKTYPDQQSLIDNELATKCIAKFDQMTVEQRNAIGNLTLGAINTLHDHHSRVECIIRIYQLMRLITLEP